MCFVSRRDVEVEEKRTTAEVVDKVKTSKRLVNSINSKKNVVANSNENDEAKQKEKNFHKLSNRLYKKSKIQAQKQADEELEKAKLLESSPENTQVLFICQDK